MVAIGSYTDVQAPIVRLDVSHERLLAQTLYRARHKLLDVDLQHRIGLQPGAQAGHVVLGHQPSVI
jgi:hypothetical protein